MEGRKGAKRQALQRLWGVLGEGGFDKYFVGFLTRYGNNGID